MRGAVPPLAEYVFMAQCLVKHRDNFILLYPLGKSVGRYLLTYLRLKSQIINSCYTYSLRCTVSEQYARSVLFMSFFPFVSCSSGAVPHSFQFLPFTFLTNIAA